MWKNNTHWTSHGYPWSTSHNRGHQISLPTSCNRGDVSRNLVLKYSTLATDREINDGYGLTITGQSHGYVTITMDIVTGRFSHGYGTQATVPRRVGHGNPWPGKGVFFHMCLFSYLNLSSSSFILSFAILNSTHIFMNYLWINECPDTWRILSHTQNGHTTPETWAYTQIHAKQLTNSVQKYVHERTRKFTQENSSIQYKNT